MLSHSHAVDQLRLRAWQVSPRTAAPTPPAPGPVSKLNATCQVLEPLASVYIASGQSALLVALGRSGHRGKKAVLAKTLTAQAILVSGGLLPSSQAVDTRQRHLILCWA